MTATHTYTKTIAADSDDDAQKNGGRELFIGMTVEMA
jgi:hypothetical protein